MSGAKEFIPSRAAEVTPEWCTAAMRASGAIGGDCRVRSVATEKLSGGTGMAGETVRLRFTYDTTGDSTADTHDRLSGDGAEPPSTAVAKFAHELPVIKGLLESIDAYGREVAFYQDLSQDMPLRVPQYLGGGADPGRSVRATRMINRVVNGLPARAQLAMTVDPTKLLRPSKRRYALMIEDLGDDFIVHDVVEPPSPEQLKVPLTDLAKLHAAFWGRSDLADHGATGRLICPTPKLYQNVYHGRIRSVVAETWSDWWTDEFTAMTDEANRRLAEDVDTINQGVTFVHGDPRSDNLLFSADGNSVTFVDWSLPAYAHPAFDVGYHLSAALRPEDAHQVVSLGEFYLSRLEAEGQPLGAAEFWSVVKAALRAMLAQQIQAIPHPLSSYGDKNLEDYWAPRILHVLAACPA